MLLRMQLLLALVWIPLDCEHSEALYTFQCISCHVEENVHHEKLNVALGLPPQDMVLT